MPIVAEDLGVITDDVNALRVGIGAPGMVVLQFAWGSGGTNIHLPHNHYENSVCYPGEPLSECVLCVPVVSASSLSISCLQPGEPDCFIQKVFPPQAKQQEFLKRCLLAVTALHHLLLCHDAPALMEATIAPKWLPGCQAAFCQVCKRFEWLMSAC